jgi:penicillin amidase
MPDSLPTSPLQSPPAPLQSRRNRRWPRILLWCCCALLVLLALAPLAGVLWLRAAAKAALPQLDGDLHLVGLSAPVTVRRDAHGVPHIDAAFLDDLLVAQGYVTAQDRLWQMDGLRRGANGELAEILGPSLVEHDKTQRVLQIRLTARRVYDRQSPAARRILDDYARGVNLFIAQCEQSNSLPVEFRLLHYHPQPWTGVDSISVGLAMVQTLDLRIVTKLSRARISARLNDPKLEADLYPVGSWRDYPPTGIKVDLSEPQPMPPPTKNGEEDDEDENTETRAVPPVAPVPRPALADSPTFQLRRFPASTAGLQPYVAPGSSPAVVRASTPALPAPVDTHALMALLGQPDCLACAVGSNNWVIAGTHTASGRPLLSNDMHLTLREPDTWYIADLYSSGSHGAPGFHAAGVTLPGMPLIVAGHNEHVAWGFTALYADVEDLYTEKLDGKGNYEGNDAQWHPLTVDREVIAVRGGHDLTLNVQSTEHGPLLNPLLAASDPPTALKWTLYDPALNKIPLYEMNTASNWAEFSAALAQWCWPTQNLVYADDQGHIAYHAIGRVPIRAVQMSVYDVPLPHDVMNNRLEWFPSPNTNPPQIYIPFDAMPSAFDPPSGFLATANSRVTTDKSPYALTDEWGDPYRVERIYKSLDGRDHLTPADMLAVQTDIYNEVDQEMGHRFAYAIDHTPGPEGNGDARMRQAADLMRSWDGRLTTDSAAASVVTQTRAALWSMIFEPKLGKLASDYHWSEATFAEEEIVMHAKPEWLPPGYKNWDELLTAAVRKGMKNGKAPADLAEWSYGSWHVVDIEHPLASFLPLIGRIAGTGPQPQSGDGTTVKQVGRTLGSSQRFTMDWSNIDGSTENIVLGESGDPLSPYFRDQWNDWYNGTTFTLPFTPSAVAAQTRHTLRLLP